MFRDHLGIGEARPGNFPLQRVKFLGSGRSAPIGISSSPRVAYVLVHGHAGATARAVQKSLTWGIT